MTNQKTKNILEGRLPHKTRLIKVLETASTLQEIYNALPDIPQSSIRRNLHELKIANVITKTRVKKWMILVGNGEHHTNYYQTIQEQRSFVN